MKIEKHIKFAIAYLIPSFIKNIYLMLRFMCIIHPFARIIFLKNLRIGKGTVIGKCDIIAQKPICIGKGCKINDFVILNSKTGYINIGEKCAINNFSVIYGNGGLDIGESTAIAHGVKILKKHEIPKYRNIGYGGATQDYTKIGSFVWIGANTVIIDGLKIGNNSIVGANSFINKDIQDDSIYAGSPAKLIRKRDYVKK